MNGIVVEVDQYYASYPCAAYSTNITYKYL